MATMMTNQRRSLKYIRLAAHLAGQPAHVRRLTMTIPEIETLIGAQLPSNSRFPSWWRNDERKMHSRAWLAAGWEVAEVTGPEPTVAFVRGTENG